MWGGKFGERVLKIQRRKLNLKINLIFAENFLNKFIKMKIINISFVIIILLMLGCGGNKQTNDDFITIDVTASYPKKELILQDFMDVEYIPLETRGEFYCQGVVEAVGKDVIIVKNRIRDGNIFIFDRNGKGLRKFNHMGRGPEEYLSIRGIVLDEDNGEMFINSSQKIIVYDLFGKFKRSFNHKKEANYNRICNYDRNNLICHDGSYRISFELENIQAFFIVSKQDGSVTKKIEIPFEYRKTQNIWSSDMSTSTTPGEPQQILLYRNNLILFEISSDTLFRYLPDHSIESFLARSPSIQTMNPEVFLFPGMLTDHYYFMEALTKEYNFNTGEGFPRKYLMYDRRAKAIFEYMVYNDDFSGKWSVNMTGQSLNIKNYEIASCHKLEADDLFEAYKKGQLKEKLKDIAAELKEEDNPVLMMIKYKK